MEDKLRKLILRAPIGSHERDCLRVILGEIVSRKKYKQPSTVIKDMLRDNEEDRKYYWWYPHELNRIAEEKKILRHLL